ncbi:MAG: precorrin-8X methylmutase [Lachnospiraceae bacterium]
MIIKRVIHTSADFELYSEPPAFRENAVQDRTEGTEKRRNGSWTDTKMALSGDRQ